MKKTLIVLSVLALTGCASIQNAGTAEYTVRPFKDSLGGVVCCEVQVRNGKEIANLEAHISKQGDNYTVDLKEQGVAAFKGQELNAGVIKAAVDAAVKATLAPLLPGMAGPALQLLK